MALLRFARSESALAALGLFARRAALRRDEIQRCEYGSSRSTDRSLRRDLRRGAHERPQAASTRASARGVELQAVLVAQALAKDTQRLSGYPYTLTTGHLSDGGRVLDGFLARFDHTIDHQNPGNQYAYATDLVHWFPGRDNSGADIVPSAPDIELCWRWLEEELRLVQPDILVALGLPAAKELLSRYAGVPVTRREPKLRDLVRQRHWVSVDGRKLPLFVVYHPSRAWQFPESGSVFDWTAAEIGAALRAA